MASGPTQLLVSSESVVDDALRRLRARLGSQWRAGERLPTVRALADELDVSQPTAYRAIRELVRSGFLVSRARQGVYVSDRYSDTQLQAIFANAAPEPGPAAPPLEGKRVAVYLPPESTHMWPAYEAAMDSLSPMGCEIARGDYRKLVNDDYVLDCPDVDALVLLNPDVPLTVRRARHQHLVVATSAAGLPQVSAGLYDLVSVEQEFGSQLAARYLKANGCRDVAYLGVFRGDVRNPDSVEITSFLRLHGFECGWGRRLDPSHYLPVPGYSSIWGARAASAYAAMNPRPEAVFAASDDLAFGFINGLAVLGLELHRDYQLVSFDGQRRLEQLPGGVCSVAVPAADMGRQAVQLLVSRIQNPQQPLRKVLLGCSLNRTVPESSAQHG